MNELIISTLRMRPDRLIVGEIRSKEEVNSFIDTILAGQGKGSYATFHGLSIPDTVERLLKLGVLEQDLNALDLIILQRRWNTIDLKTKKQYELRKIVEIAELVDKKPVPIYKYDFGTGIWQKTNESTRIKNKIEIIFKDKFEDIFRVYENKLSDLNTKTQNMQQFFESVNDLWSIIYHDIE